MTIAICCQVLCLWPSSIFTFTSFLLVLSYLCFPPYQWVSDRPFGRTVFTRIDAAAFISFFATSCGVYSRAASFRRRRLFKNHVKNFIEASAENKLLCTSHWKEKERSRPCSTSEVSALTAELRVAKIVERELINTRAKKYSHFELKNVVLKENKFPLLV